MYSVKVQLSTGIMEMTQLSLADAKVRRYLDDESIRQRDEITGSIVFYGDDAKRIAAETSYYLIIYIYEKGQQIITGRLNLPGIRWKKSNMLELEVESIDNYTKLKKILGDKVRYLYQHTRIVQINYNTYSDIKYYGATDLAEPPIPPAPDGYLGCGDFYDLNEWDQSIAYIGSIEITPDEAYEGSLLLSFCSYNGLLWVALVDNQNKPPGTGSQWLQIDLMAEYKQERSLFQFTGSTYNEFTKIYWAASCNTQLLIVDMSGLDLFSALSFHLTEAGYTLNYDNFLNYIKDNYPNELRVMLHFKDREDLKEMTMQEMLDIYIFLFNVDWVLEGKELLFKHPTELLKGPPGSNEDYPNYYINKVFAKDWSSEKFSFDLRNMVYKEEFRAGESLDPDYSGVDILYDTPFDTVTLYELKDTDLDIVYGLSELSDNNIILMAFDNNTDVVFMSELSLIKLVNEHYQQGRPFANGEIRGHKYKFTTEWNNLTEIQIPYTRQDLLNFDYLIVTSYGNLKVNELSVSLNSASASIKASKR